jgi:hypothetical protein
MNKRYANPYVIGVLLGLTLLFTFYTMGRGLGSSSAIGRLAAGGVQLVAPGHAGNIKYFSGYLTGRPVLMDWLVFLMIGAGLGSLLSSFMAGRLKGEIVRGPSIDSRARLWLALGGGVLSGFAARLARGCVTGQALTGASELAFGSWIFMFSVFVGAYGTAYFFRKEWL